jgi:hypothetical protein
MEAEKKSSNLMLKLHRAHADAIMTEAIAACSPASPTAPHQVPPEIARAR